MDMDTEVRDEVVEQEASSGEEIPSGASESASGGSVQDATAEELERLRKQMREFQSRADRAEAELKELRRREMSDLERLQDELTEKERELEGYRAAYAQLLMERRRIDLIRKYDIPADFEEFLPVSYDEIEMEEKAKKLAAQIQRLAKQEGRVPITGGGAPPSEPSVEALMQEAKKKGDVRSLLRLKLGEK